MLSGLGDEAVNYGTGADGRRRGSVDSGKGNTIPIVLEPTRKPARKPKRVVVPFSVPKTHSEVSGTRIQVRTPGGWEWPELGFAVVLLSSVFVQIFLSLVAPGRM
jgi:hypothetical protein